jgi:hypothetical protein
LVWEPSPGSVRASLTAVIALSRSEAIAVGFALPEGSLVKLPVSFLFSGSSWTASQVPPPAAGGSVELRGAARSADAAIWACGRTADNELEPTRLTPVVYRQAAGVWSEVSLDELGDLNSVQLLAIAATGTGASLVVRAVGCIGPSPEGFALEFSAGHWKRLPLPAPDARAMNWSLTAVGRAPDGKWYAAGPRRDGAGGGATFVDDGRSGWQALRGPAEYSSLEFTALAFDADGDPWFAGNYPVGDSLQGVLFSYRAGAFTPVTITRKSGGGYRLLGLGFDVEGHGWAVGGRTRGQPFFAGNSVVGWTESISERDADARSVAQAPHVRHRGARPKTSQVEQENVDLSAVSVFAEDAAFAVGNFSELDEKGITEFFARLYTLVGRPFGETDALAPPTGP